MGQSQHDTWNCKVCRNKSGTAEAISKMHEFKIKLTNYKQISELKTLVEFFCSKIDKYDKWVGKYERNSNMRERLRIVWLTIKLAST